MPLRFFTLIAVFGFLITSPVFAVDYTIRNLAVDVEGETAIDAREKALTQARSNAFNVLKKRLSQSTGSSSDIPTPDSSVIASMVDSFEINREKLSKNRYLASINVTFNQRAVQGYIARNSNSAMPDYALGRGGENPYGRQQPQATVQREHPQREAYQSQYDRYARQNAAPSSQSRTPGYARLSQSKVRIDVAGVQQWVSVKKLLESMYSIDSIELEQITSNKAVVSLTHQGSINDLQSDLIGRGMKLYANTDEMRNQVPYVLLTRG